MPSGMWISGQNLWWEPLPPKSHLEAVFSRLRELPTIADSVLEAVNGEPGWAQIDRLVPTDLIQLIHADLDSAWKLGVLDARCDQR